jgi:hypothetical protein
MEALNGTGREEPSRGYAMVKVLDVLVTVVLFAGFVFLTLLLAACRWVEGELTGQRPSL